jgi:phosphatidate phosphatase APP1
MGLFDDVEDVTFYTAYGYRDAGNWRIPLRLRVHEPQPRVEGLVATLVDRLGEPSDHEAANLRQRITDLLSDSESLEQVVVAFDDDPAQREWRVRDPEGGLLQRTDLNGNLSGELVLSDACARELLAAQRSGDGWLSFRTVFRDHRGRSRVRLVEPRGLSVISDIDDTIKITGILDGAEEVLRNTFLRDFVAAPGMVDRYRAMDAAFHYVSGGPWQLFPPLSRFLAAAGYPCHLPICGRTHGLNACDRATAGGQFQRITG